MNNASLISSLALLCPVFLVACGDVVIDPGPSSSSTAGQVGAGGGAGSGGAGGHGGSLAACDALKNTMPAGVSRWLFELDPVHEAVGLRHVELVDTGLEGDDSTLLLALARATDGGTVLLASRFDGRKGPLGEEPVLLPRTAIPLADTAKPTRLQATRGAAGKVHALLTGDTSAHLLRIDASSLAIESVDDLGGGASPLFLAASMSDFLAGVQPLPTPSPVSLVSKAHPSLALATSIGCPDGFAPATAMPTDQGFLVGFVASGCPSLGEDGFYVTEVIDGALAGPPNRVDLDFDPWLPSLVRVGDRAWLALEETAAGFTTVHAVPLDLHGSRLGDARALGSNLAGFPTARLGASVAVGFHIGTTDSTMTFVATTGETLGTLPMGSGAAATSPMDVEVVREQTLLMSWGYPGADPHDAFVHVEQARCTSGR